MELIEILREKDIDFSIDGEKITVKGSLDLSGTKITCLPDNLSVGASLDLSYTKITSLPDNLTIGGWLDLRGTAITRLPDNLTVGDSLYLVNTNITRLPENLTVGRWLNLRDTKITSLPDNLKVGGSVDLSDFNISNLACRHNCGETNRTIFAAKLRNGVRIFAGCFQGTLDEFSDAVNAKYSGDAAREYIDQAQECVKEL